MKKTADLRSERKANQFCRLISDRNYRQMAFTLLSTPYRQVQTIIVGLFSFRSLTRIHPTNSSDYGFWVCHHKWASHVTSNTRLSSYSSLSARNSSIVSVFHFSIPSVCASEPSCEYSLTVGSAPRTYLTDKLGNRLTFSDFIKACTCG